jgi:hypothetical protein
MSKSGPKPDLVRKALALRFGLTPKQRFYLTDSMMAQLSFCKSDCARRLILGISEKEK